jgi:hypothetical protein
MNITPQAIPIPTAVNPQTDNLRRENNIREVIAQPAAASQSAGEKGVASDREKAKTPAQNNEFVDFENIRKKAEKEASEVSGDSGQQQGSSDDSSQSDQPNSGNETSAQNEKSSIDVFAEQQKIEELKQRDKEVRSHELAHASVGGASTGAPSYSFEVGPDGKRYAVSGEVSVDLSRVDGNPRATIAKMQKVHAAALAPANPSVQDTRVAASASKIIAQAQTELSAIALDDPEKIRTEPGIIKSNDVFAQEAGDYNDTSGADFDRLVNQTLKAQEEIAPSRDVSVNERALRIEGFYSDINQAYEKEPRHHFQLTA